MSMYKFFCNGCVYAFWTFTEICRAKFFYSWVKRVKIGSSGVVSISSDMTYNVLEVHFYVAISKCKVWHTKTSKLKMLVTNLFIDKMS